MGDNFLETDRLSLRRVTEADAQLLFDLDADPEVTRYTGKQMADLEAYRDMLRTKVFPHYASHPARGLWAALEKPAGAFVGWFLLRPATWYTFAREAGFTRDTDAEVGYRLKRSAWGRGLATDGAAALVRLALADPGVTCVVATALVPNRGSTRVMEKVGLAYAREFALAGYDDPAVVYARCRDRCSPP